MQYGTSKNRIGGGYYHGYHLAVTLVHSTGVISLHDDSTGAPKRASSAATSHHTDYNRKALQRIVNIGAPLPSLK